MNSNKEVIRRIVEEVFNQGKVEVVDEVLSENFTDHTLAHAFLGGTGGHREGFKQMVRSVLAAFSEFKAEIDQMIAEGDYVAMRNHATGIHTGPFMGIPPTQKRINMVDYHFFRFQNGKIAEHWNQLNTLEILQDLGVAPRS